MAHFPDMVAFTTPSRTTPVPAVIALMSIRRSGAENEVLFDHLEENVVDVEYGAAGHV